MVSRSLLPLLLCWLVSSSLADSTDDLLRLELEEAASDSRLLAEELAGMLARLDTENSRQEAVEAAVVGIAQGAGLVGQDREVREIRAHRSYARASLLSDLDLTTNFDQLQGQGRVKYLHFPQN